MINHTFKHLGQSALYAAAASLTIVALLFVTFFVSEPVISIGQTTQDFTITQTILDESSITVAGDVTMNQDINGVTGGYATGTTQFTVTTNNAAGYSVTIAFDHTYGAEAMYGDTSGSEALRDYDGDVGGEPSNGFTASTAAQFAYTITSSTSADTDQSFLYTGGADCNDSGGSQTGDCWKEPTAAAFTIASRGSSAINGATSTLKFRVDVPAGATPVPVADTYTATATLTLNIN